MKFIKLDIGCGINKREGYIGIDFVDYSRLYSKGEFIKLDISKQKLPFKDSSVDVIFAKEIFEEVPDLNFIKDEVYRVLKHDGVLEIIVPHFSSITAFNEINLYFFRHAAFLNNHFDKNRFIPISKKITFYKGRHVIGYLKEWLFNKFPRVYETSCLRNLFPAWQLHGIFKIRKD